MRDRAEQNEILSNPLRHAEAEKPLRRAVLFCDGFMGSPRRFLWLLPESGHAYYSEADRLLVAGMLGNLLSEGDAAQ